ncbi:hypothetical protein CsatA_015209 [Cannabis sativa]
MSCKISTQPSMLWSREKERHFGFISLFIKLYPSFSNFFLLLLIFFEVSICKLFFSCSSSFFPFQIT